HVARPAERVVRLLQPELADVSRDGGLCDPATCGRECLDQLVLRADPLALDDAGDQPLTPALVERPALILHTASINRPSRSAEAARFWADRRWKLVGDAAQGTLDRALRRARRREHDRRAQARVEDLADRDRRRAAVQEMCKGEPTIGSV